MSRSKRAVRRRRARRQILRELGAEHGGRRDALRRRYAEERELIEMQLLDLGGEAG